ncbi:MAG: ferredoxin [bacterium]|nr:ferredoxin [bacterium]
MTKNLKDPKAPSGPTKVGQFIVHIDRDLCIGAGTCVALALKAFALDEQGKAVILDSADKETEDMLLEAARSCPTAAIILKKESGEKIFPQ